MGAMYEEESVNPIWIPHGLIGFPGLTRYRLHTQGEEDPFLLLQSEEKEQIRFSLIDPMVLRPDYEVRLSADHLEELEIETRADVSIYAIVTVPDDPRRMTANFRAPLVINRQTGVALQVILDDENLPVRATLVGELERELLETLAT